MSMHFIGRNKRTIVTIISCLFLILLTACGEKEYVVSTMDFQKDGKIVENLIEDFDTSIYDADELKAEIEKEISAYNKGKDNQVSLLEFKCENNKVYCKIEYPSDDAYFDINSIPIYYGTVAGATKAGYNLPDNLINVKDGKNAKGQAVANMKDLHILIINQSIDVNTYKDIKYASEGVTLGDDHSTATVIGDSTAYIVFD